jgi:hypothetical protein
MGETDLQTFLQCNFYNEKYAQITVYREAEGAGESTSSGKSRQGEVKRVKEDLNEVTPAASFA